MLLLALGEHKCSIVRETLEGTITDRVPASYLQEHADARALLDFPAAGVADRRQHAVDARQSRMG